MSYKFENKFVVATGKGDPAAVMSEYGFKNAISLEEYASYFDGIDPVAQYKSWKTSPELKPNSSKSRDFNVSSEKIKAAFIVSDPVDWGRDIQVLCDILTFGGLSGDTIEHQPPLYFAADDLQYQAAFPSERLGMGAFRIALESVYNRIHHKPLEYTIFGKPNPFVFRNAEIILRNLKASLCSDDIMPEGGEMLSHAFETLYMIGDNPPVDIKGARLTGHPWFSILTRTGVFREVENHAEYPADLPNTIISEEEDQFLQIPLLCFRVVDTVEEAVEYIFRREDML
ncbi:hypothetical protein M9H77_34770 [Catharanthus roseus]|uniref:Uncharacterized protein n=1 Tax=Catharanthus roseus TaxID=4058 RepID=A0ACB9ZMV7_CATRO|nr:hypothetical protein M9H77_34770 [Catharanthus roseus]